MGIRKKIVIIHYLPIEFYPPVTNFINFLYKAHPNFNLIIFSTHNDKDRNQYKSNNSTIHRVLLPSKRDNSIIRFLKYIYFNLYVLLGLIKLRPKNVLYYESYSSYPVYLYKKFFDSKVGVLIHNHEYCSKEWYDKGMRIVKYYHKKEQKFLYKNALWISQTNKKRSELFYRDNPELKSQVLNILPNYPSEYWPKKRTLSDIEYPMKIIYVGSLSKKDCYIEEFCNFVKSHPDKIVFDIYCYNLDNETQDYLNSLEVENITYYSEGIEYAKLPNKLIKYDIGTILYKAESINFKYNAPNKLFEYLSCGLDVWYPIEMLGIEEYARTDQFPKVIGLNFKNLEQVDLKRIIDRKDMNEKQFDLYYEIIYNKLAEKLFNSDE